MNSVSLSKLLQITIGLFFSFGCLCSESYGWSKMVPDRVIMRNGTVYQGMIIRSDAQHVVLQQGLVDRVINNSDIQRIDDANKSMSYFADLVNRDKAPPWRMMVQDLRWNDAIKSFVQIPATSINEGYLKNVPYLSFHVNKHGEMNIYGDPRDPACVELGAYSRGEHLKQFQEIARQFFAGYVGSRSSLATLYHLNLNGDEQKSGKFTYKVMPPSAPDAHGGWWLSVYDPVRLNKARVSDAEYKTFTMPASEVRTRDGQIKNDTNNKYKNFLDVSMMRWLGKIPGFRGFYRNDENELCVIPASKKTS